MKAFKNLRKAVENLKSQSIRTTLIVPFSLQIVGTVGLVGYFSFSNDREAVNDLANQLQTEISDRIQENIEFLRSLEIGETGKTFIIERSGDLVAMSTGEDPFINKVGKSSSTDFTWLMPTVPVLTPFVNRRSNDSNRNYLKPRMSKSKG